MLSSDEKISFCNKAVISSILIVRFCYVHQMGAVETNFEEATNIFDIGGVKGLPGDLVEKIPKIKISKNNNIDDSGERVSCSVCLQVRALDFF